MSPKPHRDPEPIPDDETPTRGSRPTNGAIRIEGERDAEGNVRFGARVPRWAAWLVAAALGLGGVGTVLGARAATSEPSTTIETRLKALEEKVATMDGKLDVLIGRGNGGK